MSAPIYHHSVQQNHSSTSSREYAFEMACSNIRFGEGVTKEVGMDLVNLRVENVCVVTDVNVSCIPRPCGGEVTVLTVCVCVSVCLCVCYHSNISA